MSKMKIKVFGIKHLVQATQLTKVGGTNLSNTIKNVLLK